MKNSKDEDRVACLKTVCLLGIKMGMAQELEVLLYGITCLLISVHFPYTLTLSFLSILFQQLNIFPVF